ncbi:MAG TPA: nucleotidyltransferase [Gemmataceae bacterium]|nr:nucleotidyltransferase [Gemmataceae bacterium]
MASEADFLTPLLGALRDLLTWWKAAGVEGVIIGGLAVALIGRPRVTRDLDGLVWLDEARWEVFLETSKKYGFEARQANVLALAREARVLLLRHLATGIDIDVAFAALPFEREALDRAQRLEIQGISVPLPTPEDLIIMKAIAHRARDRVDVEGLIDTHPKLNRSRVRKYVREFANLLEAPELAEDIERMLSRRRGSSGRRKPPPKRGNK